MREVLKIVNKLRRELNCFFYKNYIDEKIKKRKGECLKCGECCNNCKFLDGKTNLCLVYEKRPWFCYKNFPLDELDKKVFCVKNCGYWFE